MFSNFFIRRPIFASVVSIVIAIIAYLLLHLAINGLLRMLAQRKTAI